MTTPSITPLRQWAVVGVHGFYDDTRCTRKLMIAHHTRQWVLSWRKCRQRGDRCIRVVVVAEPA